MDSVLLERCQELARKINSAAERCGAFAGQRGRRSPAGETIYPDDLIEPAKIDEAFLYRLRRERQIFSGDDFVTDVAYVRLGYFGTSFLSAFLRAVIGLPRLRRCLGVTASLDWSVSEFARSIRGLPSAYVCRMPLDNGGLRVGPYLINRETAAYQERITALYRAGLLEKLSKIQSPVILEIGAGFGALPFCLKKIVPGACYVIVDLPRSLVHAACWLAQWMPDADIAVLSPGDALSKADFVLVQHCALPLVEVTIDLSINTLSFAEMPVETVEGYADFISRHLSETGVLFEQNFDDSGVGRPEFCNPPEVLHRFFSHRRVLEGNYWRGVPSIWSAPRAFNANSSA